MRTYIFTEKEQQLVQDFIENQEKSDANTRVLYQRAHMNLERLCDDYEMLLGFIAAYQGADVQVYEEEEEP